MNNELVRRALLAAIVCLGIDRVAHADVVDRQDLFGHEVRIEQAAGGGAITIVGVGAAPIPLSPTGRAAVQRVAVGTTGAALVVRVEGETPSAAIIAGSSTVPPAVLFSGALAAHGEDVSEQFVNGIAVRDFNADGAPDVVLYERHNDITLCNAGRAAVAARGIDPATMRLRPVWLNPLAAGLLETEPTDAHAINAIAVPSNAHPSINVLQFGTNIGGVVRGPAVTLTDGNAATAWTARAQAFVTAPAVSLAGASVERIILTAPPAPAALPRRVRVFIGGGSAGTTLDASIPDGVAPGARVAIPIVPARTMRCLSLVVTEPPTRVAPGIAEVELQAPGIETPEFLTQLAQRLGTTDDVQAAELLQRFGDRGVDAVASVLPSMQQGAGRAAIRFLSLSHSPRAAVALVSALDRREIADDARMVLSRMGPEALEALAGAVATNPRAADVLLVIRAPLEARMRAMVPALSAEAPVWRTVRGTARALLGQAVRDNAMPAWLALVPAENGPALRALTTAALASERDVPLRAQIAARARSVQTTTFDDRYRALLPLAGDDEGRERVVHIALEDTDADLRAEAVRALAASPGPLDVLVRAIADTVPRVRVEAALGLRGQAAGRLALVDHLAHDTWPTVRAASARSLAGEAVNAAPLLAALNDTSVVATSAVLEALARTPDATIGVRLMDYAEDSHRNPELRREALSAIAFRCERPLVDRLQRLFLSLTDPVLPPPEQAVGHAALAALAHIDPTRARTLLRTLDSNRFGIAALERAMRNACPAAH